MKQVHQFSVREMKEIKLALFYARFCDHGTAGHNRFMLIAKLATALGLYYDFQSHEWNLPENDNEFAKEMPQSPIQGDPIKCQP